MAAKATSTVAEFLARLPPDRRREVERVRQVIRRHLPRGYEEVLSGNVLVYQVPLKRYPDTYNGQALWYVALTSGKSGLSLHLMSVYGDRVQARRLRDGFRTAGKRLDMGKACVRFRTADDLPLGTIGAIVGSMPVDRWVGIARAARGR